MNMADEMQPNLPSDYPQPVTGIYGLMWSWHCDIPMKPNGGRGQNGSKWHPLMLACRKSLHSTIVVMCHTTRVHSEMPSFSPAFIVRSPWDRPNQGQCKLSTDLCVWGGGGERESTGDVPHSGTKLRLLACPYNQCFHSLPPPPRHKMSMAWVQFCLLLQ